MRFFTLVFSVLVCTPVSHASAESLQRPYEPNSYLRQDLEKKGISIVEMPIFTTDTMMMTTLEQEIKKIDAKRLVFDSIRIFEYLYEDDNQRWKSLLRFKNFLRKFGVTAVLCFEKTEKPLEIFKFQESLPHALKVIKREKEREMMKRFIYVLKTPGKEQFEKMYRMEIGKNGIEIFK